METSEIIKKRRKELGLTLKQVAEKLGVSESLISRYESKDVKNMGIDKIIPLAEVLKCSPAYLMGWEEEKNLRNKLVHKIDVSTEDKIKFIKSIEKHFKEGMTYEEISKILDFPRLEVIMQQIVFEKDLLQLAKMDKNIFNLLLNSLNSVTREILSVTHLPFDKDDAEMNKETLEQVMNGMNLDKILELELNKYKSSSNENFKYIKFTIKKIKDVVKACKEKGRKYPFDIVHSDGKVTELKFINNTFYAFTFNINDDPIEVEYYKIPFGEISKEEILYIFLLENGKNFFNNPNISMLDKEKLINELQEEFFKAKFNIKNNK